MLFIVAAACGGGEPETPRPNLLLVTLDTLRADRLGCYGYEAARTPAIDGLAERGTLFEEAHTPAPLTLPAHATVLTGLAPPQHGARVNGEHRLAAGIPTLPERLVGVGYRTGAFVAAFVLDPRFGLDRGFEVYDADLSEALEQEVDEALSRYRSGDRVVDGALEWLDEVTAPTIEGRDGAPFFAWVHLYDAHYPWHAHDAAENAGPGTGTYDGEVAFLDEQVDRLLGFLTARGLAERTLVCVLADHGEGLGDHRETEHGYLLNEEVLHVPWIVAGPGVAAGARVPALVTLADLAPTIAELLDLDFAPAGPGRSLVSALRGEAVESAVSYAETDLPWTGYRWAPQRSLTTAEWKYVRTPQPELYDRARDRAELDNLVEVRPEVRIELERRLRELEVRLGEVESESAALSPTDLAHLADLGYGGGNADTAAPAELEGLADVKERLGAKDLHTRLRRGLATESLGIEERLELARELVRRSPETPAFHHALGTALLAAGEAQEGIGVLARVLEMAPGSAEVHYELGDALQQRGRAAEARPHLERALELAPDMPAAHVGMGNVLRDEGRPDLAAGHYVEALRLQPEYPEACYNLALSYLDRNRAEEAEKYLTRALELRPGWGIAHASLAHLLAAQGRPGEAVEHYRGALADRPGDPDLMNDLGVALDALGRTAAAREQYEAALAARPDFFRPHVNLANQALAAGDAAGALRELEAALQAAPGHPEPTTRLARLLATSPDAAVRDGERAVALAERARDLTEGRHARTLDTLAAAYAAAGRFPEAVRTAHEAQKLARRDGDPVLAGEIEERLALYALDRPFVESPPPAPHPDEEDSTP